MANSPLDPAAAGWHLTPRAWRASEVYRALRTAEARHVAELVLFDMPRFQDETHYFGGQALVIRRGQLFAAEETIAKIAGTSRKVVRTGLRSLITAGLITRERVHPSGQCPHVITVREYELSQTLPGNGANGRANEGPETGQRGAREGAPSKPQEPQEPQEPSLVAEADPSTDAGPLKRVVELWNSICVPAGFAQAKSTPQQRKAARTRMREPGWLEAFAAACEYVAEEPFYRGGGSSGWVLTLGWLLKPGNAEKTAERAATRKAPPADGRNVGGHGRVPPHVAPLPESALWRRVVETHDALPYGERWNGLAELRGRDDGAGGLLVIAANPQRAEGLTALGWPQRLSTLAGGVPVRIVGPEESP